MSKDNQDNQDEAAKWAQIQHDIKTIRAAVVGDESIGLTGLVKRVDKVEDKLKTLDLRIAFGAGAAFILGILVKFIFKL